MNSCSYFKYRKKIDYEMLGEGVKKYKFANIRYHAIPPFYRYRYEGQGSVHPLKVCRSDRRLSFSAF